MLKLARKEVELYASNFRGAGPRVDFSHPVHIIREPVQKPPPKGKYSAEWTRILEVAKLEGSPDPEKLADSVLRSKERTLEIAAKRHKLIKVDKKPPRDNELPSAIKAICKAMTMSGSKCAFKAVCGDFCKKHAAK